ncbi:MAG: hypothetical protein Q7T33_01005 [Dehalococcoidia bacterium]|nr:hypothetical protein [Dehalococcoidia bacterium]
MAAAIALFVLAILAVACGGGGGDSGSSPGGSPAGSPTPDPQVRKLSAARLEAGNLGSLNQAMDLAYNNHPEIAQLHVAGQTDAITQPSQGQNLRACEKGFPGDEAGGATIIETDRMLGCAEIAVNFYDVYQQTRFPEAYDVAAAAVNYLLTELPQKKGDFDTLLQQEIQDSSPPGLPSPVSTAATPSGSSAASSP